MSIRYEEYLITSAGFLLNNNASLGHRQPNTSYYVGNISYHSSLPTGYYLECITTGISANNELIINNYLDYNTITDGTVIWKIQSEQQNFKKNNSFVINANLCTQGIYGITNETLNIPISAHGTLICFKPIGEFLFQIYMSNYHPNVYDTHEGLCLYIRRKVGDDAFSNWYSIPLANESINNINMARNGYVKFGSLFGGLLIQWGNRGTQDANGNYIYFPVSFTQVANIFISTKDTGDIDAKIVAYSYVNDYEKFRPYSNKNSEALNFSWFAIGY